MPLVIVINIGMNCTYMFFYNYYFVVCSLNIVQMLSFPLEDFRGFSEYLNTFDQLQAKSELDKIQQ